MRIIKKDFKWYDRCIGFITIPLIIIFVPLLVPLKDVTQVYYEFYNMIFKGK